MKKNKSKNKKQTSQLASNKQGNKQGKQGKQGNQKQSKYERMQTRYLEKKRNEKPAKLPTRLSKAELENWKVQLEPLVSESNKRIEMIQSAGYVSYALDRVIYEGGTDYFDLENVKNREELLREMTRMRVFINDSGSTLEGAKLQTAQINASEYKGKFGNEYNNEEHGFARFDTSAIDKDVAMRAFEAYRKIESLRSSQIVGEGSYGSENLINALYDAEMRGMDSLVYGIDLLNTFYETETTQWKAATASSNMVTGITGYIEDNITGGYLF